MTADNEFFMLLGGGIVGLGTLLLALIWRCRASAGSFWSQFTKGQDDAD